MTHDTPARTEARGLKQNASKLARESKALEGIEDAGSMAGEKQAEASRLREMARELQEKARLEDLNIWVDCIVRPTSKGEKKYGRWMAGWREGNKVRKVYLGSCRKMSQAEALQMARVMKAEALGIRL